MDEQQREFKGVWIPKEIWLDERLNLQEKFYLSIYKEIQNEILTDKLMLVNISKSTLLKVKKGLYKKQLLRKITTAKEAKEVVLNALQTSNEAKIEISEMKNIIKRTLTNLFFKKTKRKPMIIPMIMEI